MRLSPRMNSVLLALSGALVFWYLGAPLPFLFGPMTFCLIAALGGVTMKGLGPVAAAARTILGVAVGASITPEVLQELPRTGLSVAFVPIYIILIGVIGVPFFRKVAKLDPVTAFYGSMPGGLQDMLAFGMEAGANPRQLSLIHATRVLIIVTLAPFVLTQFYGVSLDNPVGEPAADLPISEMLLMALAAIGGWKIAEKVNLFGAAILGPLIATVILSLTGLIHHRPPAEAILTAQFFIGMTVGVHYSGITVKELVRVVLVGVAFMLLLALLAIAFAEMVVLLGLARPLDAFMAFSPGGQSEMTVLAIITGADLGFVIMHHLARLVLVIIGAPIAAKLMGMGARKSDS